MFERIKGKDNFLKLMLALISLFGIYLIVAWISYSPSDNAWTVANNVTTVTLNKTGFIGAWCMDILYAMFGKTAFIVPLTLAFVPIYYFVLGADLHWNWVKFFTRVLSFLALMVGLSMLSHTLLSNTREYLSGGFIGSMLSHWVQSGLGLFGALFSAMILTIVGFYFCSAQTLLQLGSRLYTWIFTDLRDLGERNNAPQSAPTPADSLAEYFETKVESAAEGQSNASDSAIQVNLTDVTQFTRPKITGLHNPAENGNPPLPTKMPQVELTDTSVFSRANKPVQAVENTQNIASATAPLYEASRTPFESPLPTVSLGERVENPAPIQQPVTEYNFSRSEAHLPKIVLNSDESNRVQSHADNLYTTEPSANAAAPAEPKVILPSVTAADEIAHEPQNSAPLQVNVPAFIQPSFAQAHVPATEIAEEEEEFDYEAELARQFAEQEEARIREMEARAKQQGLDETFQQIMETPKVVPVSPKTSTHTENTRANSNPYPHGYGQTLIHPLLKQPTRLEKPTTPLPTLELLKEPARQVQQITEQDIVETSQRLEQELANFGVKATVEDVLVGPVVTRYEIQPAPGTKASKIMGLGPDLARALMFDAIRITDKVPNKPYMGIEAPNAQRETVWLRDVLASDAFRHSQAILPMALGKDISGNPVVVDMAKMPHLLVAGQTGAGKSVGVNTMILSLLYKLTPEQVRFIMIDPKVVELAIYNDIPHLLTPVVTDMKKAANALHWAVEEMERRYALLPVLSVRNIEGYNSKIDLAAEMKQPIPNPLWRPGDTMDTMPPPLEKLSYIVLIVDEFADLLMTADGKKVEEYIQRISQKARAVGIHLILATQRPSTDVITGLIKANIPSRIAFTVATQIDSRTILDRGGAESLLNRGDMLYSSASSPDVIRVHGAYMSDDDVQRVADDWRARGKPNYIDSIVQSNDGEDNGNGAGRGGELDPLFDEIVAYVIETNVTSISGIQRRFGLGFNRAAKIIDQMEAEGIVSPPDSRSKREVLAR